MSSEHTAPLSRFKFFSLVAFSSFDEEDAHPPDADSFSFKGLADVTPGA
jgi:hypothetical protein